MPVCEDYCVHRLHFIPTAKAIIRGIFTDDSSDILPWKPSYKTLSKGLAHVNDDICVVPPGHTAALNKQRGVAAVVFVEGRIALRSFPGYFIHRPLSFSACASNRENE